MWSLNKFRFLTGLIAISSVQQATGIVLQLELTTDSQVNTISLQQAESSVADWRFYEPSDVLIRGRVELWVPSEYSVQVQSTQDNWTFQQSTVQRIGDSFGLTTWFYEGGDDAAGNEYDVFPSTGTPWSVSFQIIDADENDGIANVVGSEMNVYATILNTAYPFMSPIAAMQVEEVDLAVVPESRYWGWGGLLAAGIVGVRRRRCLRL